MSKLFKKSKKSLVILLTIAFVMSIAAVPAFAGTSYSSITTPTVPDADDQKLGIVSIEIDPLVEDVHEAWIEVEDGWDINSITLKAVLSDDADASGDVVVDIGDETDVAVDQEVDIDDDSFTLAFDTSALATDDLEVRIEFTSVDVDDAGPIRAYFTHLEGQFVDGDVLIGRGQAGELLLSVREYDHFSDEANVEIRVVEDVYGTFQSGEKLTFELPRGFEWNDDARWDEANPFGDVELDGDPVVDGREITFTFTESSRRSAIDLISRDFAIQVTEPARAEKGDVVADVKGDYDTDPEELVVGVYGDYEYTVTPEDAETVYAGRVEQDIADITIEEDIAGTFVEGRSVTLLLPEWAKWGDLPDTVDDGDVELELRLFYGRQGREAVYRVTSAEDPGGSPRELEFEDMEIVVAPNADVGEDVVVSIAGSAGVRGEPVVGTVAAPATMEVDPINVIGIGRSGQVIGEIEITEAEAGMFKEDKAIQLMLDTDVTWASGSTIEVVEGDIELGTVTGVGSRTLTVRVDVESDEASTLKVTGAVTTLRTVPEGDSMVRLRGPAVVETLDPEALDDQWGTAVNSWYQIDGKDLVRDDNVFPDQANAVVEVVANVGVAAPPIEEPEPTEVVMWIGLTTYTVDGEAAEMDVAPFIENDRTFVPVSFIADAFGMEADWGPVEGLTEWVTFENDNILVELEIGSPYITVTEDGVERTVTADVAAQIVNDRTYLPLRAVGEIFGASFDWGPKETLTEWVSFTLPN